jgi:hypothetical protein
MNGSEQIRGKLKALSELDSLLSHLLLERNKEAALSILSEVQEQIKTLTDSIEDVRLLIERGYARFQDVLHYVECDASSRGNKLDDEALQDKFVSSPLQDEPYGDTAASGIPSLASTEVHYYIKYQDHKSKSGCYMSKPDDSDTRFQITVSQSNPLVGILQFYAELDSYEKEGVINGSSTLIERESGPFSSQGYQEEAGEVCLDPASKTWELIKPIKIKCQ